MAAAAAGAGLSKSQILQNAANLITAAATSGDLVRDLITGSKTSSDAGARTGYILGGQFYDKQFAAEQLNTFLREVLGLNVAPISADERIQRAINFQNQMGEQINKRELERMDYQGSINRDLMRIQGQNEVQKQNVASLGQLRQSEEDRSARLGAAFLNSVLSKSAGLASDIYKTPLESRSRLASFDTP